MYASSIVMNCEAEVPTWNTKWEWYHIIHIHYYYKHFNISDCLNFTNYDDFPSSHILGGSFANLNSTHMPTFYNHHIKLLIGIHYYNN